MQETNEITAKQKQTTIKVKENMDENNQDEMKEIIEEIRDAIVMGAQLLSFASNDLIHASGSISARNFPQTDKRKIVNEIKREKKMGNTLRIRRKTKSIIKKVWFLCFIHSFGVGIAGAAIIKVVLDNVNGATDISFYYTITRAVLSFIDMILYPSRTHYADEFGRKPVLYISISAFIIGSTILSIHASLITIAISALIHSIFSIFFTTIEGVLGDLLPSQPRILGQMLAYTSVIAGIGNGLGYILGIGIIYGGVYTFVPFTLQVVIEFFAIMTVSSLPETLNKDIKKENKDEKKNINISVNSDIDLTNSYLAANTNKEFTWNIFKSIKGYIEILWIDERIKWLTIATFLATISEAGGLGVMAAFLVQQLDFSTVDVAIFIFVTAVAGGISSLCSGRLIKWLKAPLLMKISLYYSSILLCFLAFVPNKESLYAIVVLTIPFGVQFYLAKNSFIMSITPSMFQARMVGAKNIISNMAFILFSNMFSLIFWYFTSDDAFIYFPGAALLLGAFIRLMAIPFVLRAPIWGPIQTNATENKQ